MPYISQHRRDELDSIPKPETAGELNYMFTRLVQLYMQIHGRSYETMNAVTGAFTLSRGEFERRIVATYEDIKIRDNGDVYTPAETGVA